MEGDKNQTLQRVKMSVTPLGKAELISQASRVFQLTHRSRNAHNHPVGFNGDVPMSSTVCLLLPSCKNMLEAKRVWSVELQVITTFSLHKLQVLAVTP